MSTSTFSRTFTHTHIHTLSLCASTSDLFSYVARKKILDGYYSTVQGLLDWFEVHLGFTELLFIQIDLCVMCVFVLLCRAQTKLTAAQVKRF